MKRYMSKGGQCSSHVAKSLGDKTNEIQDNHRLTDASVEAKVAFNRRGIQSPTMTKNELRHAECLREK